MERKEEGVCGEVVWVQRRRQMMTTMPMDRTQLGKPDAWPATWPAISKAVGGRVLFWLLRPVSRLFLSLPNVFAARWWVPSRSTFLCLPHFAVHFRPLLLFRCGSARRWDRVAVIDSLAPSGRRSAVAAQSQPYPMDVCGSALGLLGSTAGSAQLPSSPSSSSSSSLALPASSDGSALNCLASWPGSLVRCPRPRRRSHTASVAPRRVSVSVGRLGRLGEFSSMPLQFNSVHFSSVRLDHGRRHVTRH